MNHTAEMADYLSQLTRDQLPDDVADTIKHCLLDALGVILGGAAYLRENDDLLYADYVRRLGDREESTVLGFGLKSSSRSAAFANGSLAEVLDQSDCMYATAKTHPGSSIVPGAVSFAEAQGSSGRDLLTAIAVGYEATGRAGMAVQPTHWHMGFQATGTVNTIGVAAAVGHLLGFGKDKMANALGIAGHILPISNGDGIFKGYTVKPVHGGQSAMSGIQAALMADLGMTAGPLEGEPPRHHAFIQITSSEPNPKALTDGLGKTWYARDMAFKPYPTGLLDQGPAEVAIDLATQHDINAEDVEDVLVSTYSNAVKFTGGHYTDVNSTIYDCQLSLPYSVAASILDRQLTWEQYSTKHLRDPALHDLVSRVKVVAGEGMDKNYPRDWPVEVEIRLRSGKTVKHRIDKAWGSPARPMTEAELVTKFEQLAGRLVDNDKVRKAAQKLLAIEQEQQCADVLALLDCESPY